jgi:hypothetical protein
MTLTGRSVVASWSRIPAAELNAVREWHSFEHMPERLALPGFLRGRRYHGIEDASEWFILYEADSHAALTSPPYLERLNNPTEWTRRSIAHLRGAVRGVARVVSSSGHGVGGFIATVRYGATRAPELARSAEANRLRGWILGWHHCVTNARASEIETLERTCRPVDTPNDFLLFEAADEGALRGAVRASIGTEDDAVINFYRLEMLLTA